MTCYAGLDVSLRSTHICVIDADGELLAEGKSDSEVADIVAFLDELGVEIAEVGLEAGTLTQYLTYGLQFAGYEMVCMEADRSRRRSQPCATRLTRTMRVASHSCSGAAGTAAFM